MKAISFNAVKSSHARSIAVRIIIDRDPIFGVNFVEEGFGIKSVKLGRFGRSGKEQESSAIIRIDFLTIDEQRLSKSTVEREGSRVVFRIIMFRHHDEVQVVCIRSQDQFLKSSCAMAAKKRVDVHHTFVFCIARERMPINRSLRSLNDPIGKLADLVPAIDERHLHRNKDGEDGKNNFANDLQSVMKSTETTCSAICLPRAATS